MKKTVQKGIAALLSLLMIFSCMSVASSAADETYGPYDYDEYVMPDSLSPRIKSASYPSVVKTFYNVLNRIAMGAVKIVCSFYPNPADWKDISTHDSTGFLAGRETYATEPAAENVWKVGYASASIVPDDFEAGKYYIGRDLTNRLAQGVNDDNRIRVMAADDNSGEGMVIFAAVDALGVTNPDTRAVRKAVLAWAEEQGIQIAALNLSATHSHSALDTQGVATESIYKILTASVKNLLDPGLTDPRLKNAEKFKEYFVSVAIDAVKKAILDMREGDLYYTQIDGSKYIKDKRGLIAPEDIPPIASLKFVPADGSAGVYLADISCHPTTFSASYGLLSSDYIYYLEQRIKEQTGYNFIFLQGASGQLGRMNTNVDTENLPEEEQPGASTRYTGRAFADMILAADDGTMEKLPPVLNAKYTEFSMKPDNYILMLAVKAQLVNNQIYTTGSGVGDIALFVEEGYVEFGGRVGFGVFPVELYPEVFYGSEIIGDLSWNGETWDYAAPVNMAPRDGIDMFALPLTNDSLGYCVLDNNFAFLGHIIGDEIADEVLSLGQNTASVVVEHFEKMISQLG